MMLHVTLVVNVLITACSELCKVLFLALSVTFLFEYEISRETAEQICAKFTRNMCLVPCLDELECQGQRSRSPCTKNGFLADILGIAELICDKFTQKTCLVHHSDEFEGQGQR